MRKSEKKRLEQRRPEKRRPETVTNGRPFSESCDGPS
jgi:hypothetical protein